jgi:hypothetical protein
MPVRRGVIRATSLLGKMVAPPSTCFGGDRKESVRFALSFQLSTKGREPEEITKVVVAIHVRLTRSLFGDDILRGLLPRVSLAKPTSAPLRF